MKKLILLCLALALALCLSGTLPACALQATPEGITLDGSGRMKILVIADIQDSLWVNRYTQLLMNAVLDQEQPDLVVLLGDNIYGRAPLLALSKGNTLKAIDHLLEPILSRDLPFALVMGNHDSEGLLSREAQMQHYMAQPGCLAQIGEAATGVGNYHLPVRDQDGHLVLNLWFLDSGNHAPKDEGGGYAYVSDDQIAWYQAQATRLTEENGGDPVPALLFQHIPVPEVYDLLREVPKGTAGAEQGSSGHQGSYYLLDETKARAGSLGEGPCPSTINNGQFASWIDQGDVVAAFFGHDHRNDFVGTTQGIDLVATPGTGFYFYGNGDRHGLRVIEIDAATLPAYDTRVVYYGDVVDQSIPPQLAYMGQFVFQLIVFGVVLLLLIAALVILLVRRHKRRKKKTPV